MTANQRRPGFRLPWSSDAEEGSEKPAETAPPAATDAAGEAAGARPAQPPPQQPPQQPAAAPATNGSAHRPAAAHPTAEPRTSAPLEPRPPTAEAAPEPASEPPPEFLRDLIAAMRRVADEARQGGVSRLRTEADEAVRTLEADAEKRREELRERAEADIAGVGDWARAEAERIKAEAEQRVASRRAQLEQQLAADQTRTEAEAKALRARIDDYERELDAYHAQLKEISDPAAFAAAAKRMPGPPPLVPHARAAASTSATEHEEPPTDEAAAGATTEPDEVHPAEEEVLAARLAELDAELGPATQTGPTAADASAAEPAQAAVSPVRSEPVAGEPSTTDIVVKGLGSFGAITGFRQSLASQEGISGVALSLGQTGEFIFRATHATGVDVSAAITAVEGDGATIEPRPEGGLRVTLEKAR